MRHSLSALAVALSMTAGTSLAQTQAYPVKPIRMIVPTSGGAYDSIARAMQPLFLEELGQPVVLETTHQPTFVDPNAAICWSANLQVNLSRSEGMGSFIGRTSGEHFQMQFSGPGFVVVQPDENRSGIGQTGTTQASGPGGALGGLLGGGR